MNDEFNNEDEQYFEEQSNMAKRKRPKKKQPRLITKIFIGLITIAFFGACIVLGYKISNSKFFKLSAIQVSGNQVLTTGKVKELSGIKLKENIFLVDKKQAESLIKKNVWVEKTKVKKILPDKINIAIDERKPIAIIPIENGFLEIDKNGYILKKVDLLDEEELILIYGITDITQDIKAGEKIKSETLNTGLDLLKQIEQSNEKEKNIITEISLENPQKILVHTDYNIPIYLGDEKDYLKKMNLAKSIIKQEEEEGKLNTLEYIDLSYPERPVIK